MGIRPSQLAGILSGVSYAPTLDGDVELWKAGVLATGATVPDAAVTLYNNFVIGLKADGLWDGIYDMGVFLGPSTIAGALTKLKGYLIPIVNFNFVSGDYNPVIGLQGGASKYLSLGVTMTAVGQIVTPAVQNSHAAYFDVTYVDNLATQMRLVNGTSSLAYRTLLSVQTGGLNRVRCTNSSTQSGSGHGEGFQMAAFYGGQLMKLSQGGFAASAATYSGGASGIFTIMGRTTVETSRGVCGGYSLGTGPSSGWNQTNMTAYRTHWNTLINGLKAL